VLWQRDVCAFVRVCLCVCMVRVCPCVCIVRVCLRVWQTLHPPRSLGALRTWLAHPHALARTSGEAAADARLRLRVSLCPCVTSARCFQCPFARHGACSWSSSGATRCQLCNVGYFGSSTGSTSSVCTGQCPAGDGDPVFPGGSGLLPSACYCACVSCECDCSVCSVRLSCFRGRLVAVFAVQVSLGLWLRFGS
jgi:hypothetical protein